MPIWDETNHQKSTCKEGSYSYPCFFTTDSFDDEYDNQPGHYYRTTWNSIQSVYKDRVQDWKKIVVKLFPPLLQHDNSSTKRVVLPQWYINDLHHNSSFVQVVFNAVEYDNQPGHYYTTGNWQRIQGVFKDSYQVNLAGAMAILLWTTCQVIVFDIPTLLAQLKPMVD